MRLRIVCTLRSAIVLLAFFSASALAQGGAISGKVKEQGGKALAGVAVRAVNVADKKDLHETKTASKGEFEIGGLAAGDYILTFQQAGFRTFETRRIEVEEGKTTKLSRAVELSRESAPYALIRGAVFTSAGFSLPDARVMIEQIDGGKRFKQEKASGEDGAFAFRLPPDKATYRITATARGFQPSSKEVSIDSDEIHHVALALERIR
jgi:hypothetical protein